MLDNQTQPISRASRVGAEGQGEASERPTVRRLVGSMFWDVGLAVVCYYGARALGFDEYIALLTGTLVSAARLVWVAMRDRRLDPFAMFLLVLFGAGLGLAFVTGDARFLLAKDSATSGLAGLTILISCLVRRPLIFYAAQRLVGATKAAQLRAKWATEPGMRRHFYTLSLVWGGGLLAEALLRVPLAYLLPLDVAVGASNVLLGAAFGLLILFTVRFNKRVPAPDGQPHGA
jgi:hypothetical protein